ncbi:HdeD family acid-resistance protein [Actinomyces vulturis]|uniref:HdeD family acid-resistance protein n=1 Tax=Actinomyces vulturis TaxID=1857645 RepID=UPI00082DD75E|nr:DUF308 domain-containing protein [Actinomyces vulturis]
MSSKKSRHALTLASGFLFILLAIFIAIVPMWNMVVLGIYISAAILVGGVFDLIRRIQAKRRGLHPGGIAWAVITIICGLILLSGSFAEQATLVPFFVAFWLIFMGVGRMMVGWNLHKVGANMATAMMVTGIITTIFGAIAMCFPFITGTVISYMVALAFFVLGIGRVVDFFMGEKHHERYYL